MEAKNKYLGFRIGFTDYMKTIQAAQKSGLSISDFIMSALMPQVSKYETIYELNNNANETIKSKIDVKEPLEKVADIKTKTNDSAAKEHSEKCLANAIKKLTEVKQLTTK